MDTLAPTILHAPDMLAPGKFAVGQPVSRREDPVLLRGEGTYTADKNLPGQAYLVMVRSRIAHGVLRGIDTDAASGMPGVLKILTAADLRAGGVKPMQNNVTGANYDGSPFPKPVQYALAEGKVRYVGEPIAAVIAETLMQARAASSTQQCSG
jgi:carbon-monoxide dehydrogenase large subunit